MTEVKSSRVRLIRSWNSNIYADVSLEFGGRVPELSAKQFKIIILSALKDAHGDYGASIPVNILKFRPRDCRSYIQFPTKHYSLLRSGLALLSSAEGKACAFRFNKLAYCLSSLAIEQSSHAAITNQ
ncbi:Ribonuclease P protein subunit p14 [Halotydeus destructor]|nr:Ribonuclease P protein subunit p14 [Halotydeus destructor]